MKNAYNGTERTLRWQNFSLISETADELGLECYVVGGYVRDIFLNRPSKDIDVVVVGSGIEMAQAFGKSWDEVRMYLFQELRYGTSQVQGYGSGVCGCTQGVV